jgi:hypothetical protein
MNAGRVASGLRALTTGLESVRSSPTRSASTGKQSGVLTLAAVSHEVDVVAEVLRGSLRTT